MSRRLTLALACIAGLAASAAVAEEINTRPAAAPLPRMGDAQYAPIIDMLFRRTYSGWDMAQANQVPFGTRCASNFGICSIPPAPLGSYCVCGPYAGYVIP